MVVYVQRTDLYSSSSSSLPDETNISLSLPANKVVFTVSAIIYAAREYGPRNKLCKIEIVLKHKFVNL